LRSVAERKPLPLARVCLLKVETPPEKKQADWVSKNKTIAQRKVVCRDNNINLMLEKIVGAQHAAPLRCTAGPC